MYTVAKTFMTATAVSALTACTDTWNETTGVARLEEYELYPFKPLALTNFSSTSPGTAASWAAVHFTVNGTNPPFINNGCPPQMFETYKGDDLYCIAGGVTAEEFTKIAANITTEISQLAVGEVGYGYGEYQTSTACAPKPFGNNGTLFSVTRKFEPEVRPGE